MAGFGGKRGPGSGVSRGAKGGVGLGPTPRNTFGVKLARRYSAMRGKGVVKDSGSGRNTVNSPKGHGGKRGNKSNRVSY